MITIRPGTARGLRRAVQILLLCTIHPSDAAASEPRPAQTIPAHGGHARVRDLTFAHLTTADGLSQNTVTDILQDRRGFMWFATGDGLNRYDGNAFVIYKHDVNDPGSLSHNFIRDLLEDDDGSLWVAAYPGVNRLDPRTERSTRYVYDPKNPNGLSGDSVESIARDGSGHLWLGTSESGLDRFDPTTGTFTHYRNDSDGQFVGRITHVIEDSRREIWFVGERGLFHLDPHTGKITRRSATLESLAADYVCEDDVGDLWMLAYSPIVGLIKYDRGSERFTQYPLGAGAAGLASSKLLADGSNGFWVPSSLGLHYFDRRTERLTRLFQRDETNPRGLNDDTVVSIYRDRTGLLWLGTRTGGINVLDFRQERFGRYGHRTGDRNSLSARSVMAIHEEPEGVLSMGFFPRALDRWDRHAGTVTHYLPDPKNGNALGKGGDVNSVYKDERGLWLGGWDGGLDRFDQRSGRFKHYRHDPRDPHSLMSDNVLSLYRDRRGRLWVGQFGGVSIFDPETERFTNYRPDPTGVASLAYSVSAMCEDRGGTLWLGTLGGVLSQFDDQTRTFVNHPPDLQDAHKLQGGSIGAVHEDRAGTLWLAAGTGLYRYNRERDTFTRYTESQGLPTNDIMGLLEDRAGRLWLSTKRGISRFDPRTETFRNYDVSDGLQGDEFSRGCHAQGRSGEMFFCGSNGINAFFPEDIRDDPHVPPVVLTSFKISNKTPARSALQRAIPYVESLTLAYRDNVFSFEFAALSYAKSQKNRYRYRLEGFEPDWNEVGSRQRLATYTNLDPGRYVFRVQGSNSDGVWNEKGVSLPILVTPPWWGTWWFRITCAALFLALLWAAYRVRVRSVERHAAEISAFNEQLMKAQELERTRIAGELHDSVMQQITALSLVLGTAKRKMPADSEARDMVVDVQRKLMDVGTEVRQLSHDLYPPMLKQAGLAEVLRGYCDAFSHSRGIPASCDVDDSAADLSPGAALALYRIAQEALGNAAKHAAPTRVDVRLLRIGGDVVLTVADDGRGYEPGRAADGGLGLVNMRERARQLGGTFELDSRAGRGTTVRVAVPFRMREANRPEQSEAPK
jgi:signal transduction histidine kinase/ligand-binding sensor domain-containing protein